MPPFSSSQPELPAPKRSTVMINGHIFTRAQIERAYRQLQHATPYPRGARIRLIDHDGTEQFVVLDEASADIARTAYADIAQPDDIWCVSLQTGAFYNLNPDSVEVIDAA